MRKVLILATLGTAALTLFGAESLPFWLAVTSAAAGALLIAWRAWVPYAGRTAGIVRTARTYATSTDPRWPVDYGDDELGAVVRSLDQVVQQSRRRAEEAERDQVRMQAILTELSEGVLVVDRQGRIEDINPVAQQLLPGAVTPGRHFTETVRHPVIVAELDGALRGEHPTPLVLSFEETNRDLVAHATPASQAAGGGAVLVLHDITALKTADRVRRDFVANVSHELRTPLTAIRGYLEALEDDSLATAERQEFLAIVSRHAGRMERLVTDLLRLARLESGQDQLDVKHCDTRSLVDGVLADLAGTIQARSLRLETAIEPDAAWLWCDRLKLHDALRNLVENAVNYSPPGGRLRVTARRNEAFVELVVEDEGPGIPEQELGRIFERFYRVDQSRSADPGGTGLGLSIVKHLVELHRGQVWAANTTPQGATMTVRLPANAPPDPDARRHAQPSSQ